MSDGRVTDQRLVIDLREILYETSRCYHTYGALYEQMCYYDFMRDFVIGPALVEFTNLGEGVDMLKEMVSCNLPSDRPGQDEEKTHTQRFHLFNAVVPFMNHIYDRLSSALNNPTSDVNLERFDERMGYMYVVIPDYSQSGVA